jgi:uncharacterized protein (TIGR00290 family)
MEKIPSFCSWSGGKDSCLSLYHARQQVHDVKILFSMLSEDGKHSRSHGLTREILEQQAHALDISIKFATATWDQYESIFLTVLRKLVDRNIKAGIFGDIDVEEHRQWVERVCDAVGMKATLPLWNRERNGLLTEFITLGFRAVIVAVKDDALDESWLGRTLELKMIEDFERVGIDPSGEQGEYHTFVYDGPLFRNRVVFKTGDMVKQNKYSFLELFLY